MYVIDIEVYSNYYLLYAKNIKTGEYRYFEMLDDVVTCDDLDAMKFLRRQTTISFNGFNYDLPIIKAQLGGCKNAQLKALSDTIIKTNLPSWQVLKQKGIVIPKTWDHIDLFEVAPGKSSLKIYGGRLGCKTMQDLPIEPDAIITTDDAEQLRVYCRNDLDTTEALYRSLEKQIELRKQMSEQYGLDLRSKSDAQIAEAVIKSEYSKITGETAYRPEINQTEFRYQDPGIIEYQLPHLQATFDRILATPFTLAGNGSIKLPDWLKDEPIEINGTKYQMGIGGLHSCEKQQCVRADSERGLADWDVASYYPNIILQQRLSPHSMGKTFLEVYQSIVDRRIKAKRAGDKVTADTLKICVNGSFGKLGSKYSALYSPELLIQTTITGQLALLMLIERMERNNIRVVSANTDGIVCHYPRHLECVMRDVAWDWMLDTSYELERTEYSLLASRDVNNYVAVKPDWSAKGKGVFAPTGLMKNPAFPIVQKAVMDYLSIGAQIEHTIKGCTDILQFCTVRRVQGGAVWCDEYLGKAVRFYYSDEVPADVSIHYAKNSNRVPLSDGARPMMTVPEIIPGDIDYQRYIDMAEKLLREIGYA